MDIAIQFEAHSLSAFLEKTVTGTPGKEVKVQAHLPSLVEYCLSFLFFGELPLMWKANVLACSFLASLVRFTNGGTRQWLG